jgi:hypothetical protein
MFASLLYYSWKKIIIFGGCCVWFRAIILLSFYMNKSEGMLYSSSERNDWKNKGHSHVEKENSFYNSEIKL